MSASIPASIVAFLPIERSRGHLMKLLDVIGFRVPVGSDLRSGVKVHFGEEGNRNFIPPEYASEVVHALKARGTRPVLVETTTLYRSPRQTASGHIRLAHRHGFTEEAVGAKICILDGERGEESIERTVDLEIYETVKIAKGIEDLDMLVCLSHFKGHMVTGFGGALKNLGMGLSASAGKLAMHSLTSPYVSRDRCNACSACADNCPGNAIRMNDEGARIDADRCIGCCQCLSVCAEGAIRIRWSEVSTRVQRKMVEYALGAARGMPCVYLNFLINITKNCDCLDRTERPFRPDIGVFASLDPVACDQACYERVEVDLRRLWPEIDPEIQLDYAEKVGLGSRTFELLEL
jgi:uncharacterized Fe-S center protein